MKEKVIFHFQEGAGLRPVTSDATEDVVDITESAVVLESGLISENAIKVNQESSYFSGIQGCIKFLIPYPGRGGGY